MMIKGKSVARFIHTLGLFAVVLSLLLVSAQLALAANPVISTTTDTQTPVNAAGIQK